MIKFQRDLYMDKHKILITSPDSSRNFFRNVRAYNTVERPAIWNVKALCPDLTDQQLSEELSKYFNTISNEFLPLCDDQIPKTFSRQLPRLQPYQVAGRVRAFKKPKTKIEGDIFPSLMTVFADIVALPLCDIYNEICLLYTSPSPRD